MEGKAVINNRLATCSSQSCHPDRRQRHEYRSGVTSEFVMTSRGDTDGVRQSGAVQQPISLESDKPRQKLCLMKHLSSCGARRLGLDRHDSAWIEHRRCLREPLAVLIRHFAANLRLSVSSGGDVTDSCCCQNSSVPPLGVMLFTVKI